jgi:hypothetical protein
MKKKFLIDAPTQPKRLDLFCTTTERFLVDLNFSEEMVLEKTFKISPT